MAFTAPISPDLYEAPKDFAERLLKFADNDRQEVCADYRGTLMVAFYGDFPNTVKTRWYQSAHERISAYRNTPEGFATISNGYVEG